MKRARVGPARALALAGVLAVSVLPGVASAQRARVDHVEILPIDQQISVGQQQVFMATAYDRANNAVATAAFVFSSNNSGIATIDANGIAVGVSLGTAIITVRTGTGATAKSATATLTVLGGAPAVGPANPVVQPQGVPAGAALNTPRPGVHPPGLGYAAFDHQPEGSGPAEGLVVSPPRVVLVKGESKQLEYRAARADDGNASPVPITFTIVPGGERLISVDSVGFIRAQGDTGQAVVRVEVPNSRIPPRPVLVYVRGDSVRFQSAETWLPQGAVDTLHVIVPAQDRALNLQGDFNFHSSDEAKVRVSSLRPVVTAVAAGVALITGESPFFSVGTQVHVFRRVVVFAGSPGDSVLTLALGATQAFALRPLAADSAVVTEAPLRWTLQDSATARFDSAARTLQALRIGDTRLTVAAPISRDSFTTRTWRIRVVAGGLAVSRPRFGMGVGERAPLAVQMLDVRHQQVGPATNLTWTSSADSIARFADGAVHGLKIGLARLTAHTTWDSLVHSDVYVSGQLLAAARRGGRWDLYQFSLDSVPRFVPITSDTAVESEPVFSPERTRIAYIVTPPERNATSDLWVANVDGSAPQRLTNDSANVGSPVFVRPSGEQIVFHSYKGGRAQLYIVNRDGSNRRPLTSGEAPNQQPDVSPDGRKVLFVSYRQRNYDIFEMNIDGTGERRLTMDRKTDDTPRFTPDGLSFYFLRDEGGGAKRIYRQLLADTTGAAQPVSPEGTKVQSFGVSPDGSMLVLTKIEGRGAAATTTAQLLNLTTLAVTPINLGTLEQISAPMYRPAAAPAAPVGPAAAAPARPPQ